MTALLTLALTTAHAWTVGIMGAAVLSFASLLNMLRRMGLPTIPTQFDNLNSYDDGLDPEYTGAVRLSNTPLGSIALASTGTDAASTAGTWYYSEGVNPSSRTVTTIACLNGTTVGTDLVIYAIWDKDGTVLGWTLLTGTLSAVADVFQPINLVTPITLPAGRYYVGFQVNGTTAAHQTIATLTYQNSTGSVAGTFGAAVPAITPPTTITAGVGPFHLIY
jgi:hypothetical protein